MSSMGFFRKLPKCLFYWQLETWVKSRFQSFCSIQRLTTRLIWY